MKKRLQLKDFKVRSFITAQEKIQGGTGSLPTGGICDKTADCTPNTGGRRCTGNC